jgi:hypothetical protein
MLLPGLGLSRVSGLNEPLNAIGHPELSVLETANSIPNLPGGMFSPCHHDPFVASLYLIIADPMISHCA